eukprot:4983228-Amphidinium_carterae.1
MSLPSAHPPILKKSPSYISRSQNTMDFNAQVQASGFFHVCALTGEWDHPSHNQMKGLVHQDHIPKPENQKR